MYSNLQVGELLDATEFAKESYIWCLDVFSISICCFGSSPLRCWRVSSRSGSVSHCGWCHATRGTSRRGPTSEHFGFWWDENRSTECMVTAVHLICQKLNLLLFFERAHGMKWNGTREAWQRNSQKKWDVPVKLLHLQPLFISGTQIQTQIRMLASKSRSSSDSSTSESRTEAFHFWINNYTPKSTKYTI